VYSPGLPGISAKQVWQLHRFTSGRLRNPKKYKSGEGVCARPAAAFTNPCKEEDRPVVPADLRIKSNCGLYFFRLRTYFTSASTWSALSLLPYGGMTPLAVFVPFSIASLNSASDFF